MVYGHAHVQAIKGMCAPQCSNFNLWQIQSKQQQFCVNIAALSESPAGISLQYSHITLPSAPPAHFTMLSTLPLVFA